MTSFVAPDGSSQIARYNNELWMVEGVDDATRKLHLRHLRTHKVCSVDAANVTLVDHQTLNEAAATKVAEMEAARSLILIDGFTTKQMEQAYDRFRIIERELKKEISAEQAAKECGLSRPRYYEVRRNYNPEIGHISLLTKKRGRKPGATTLSPEMEKIIADQFWLYRGQGASYRTVWKGVQAVCHELKITEVPSYETICDRMNKLTEYEKAVAVRGKDFAGDNFQLRDGFRGFNRALEQVQMDHTVADVFLSSTEEPDKSIGRPWITLAICAKTKVILGFYIGIRYPSLCSVAHTLKHAVMPKDGFMKKLGLEDHEYEFYGLFDELLTDNAREFKSANLAAACALEGIKLRHRSQKQDGGICERGLGTLNIGAVQMLPGGTASRTRKDRDYDPAKHHAMTLNEFIKYFTLAVCEYHDTRGVDGKTPRERWLEAMTDKNGAPIIPRHVHNPKNFFIEVMPEKNPTVSRTGLKVNGFRYSKDVLRPFVGKRVRVKYDPVNLSSILVLLEGEWIQVPAREQTTGTLAARDLVIKSLTKAGKRAGKMGERAIRAFLARTKMLSKALALPSPAMRKQREINAADKFDPLLKHHAKKAKKVTYLLRDFSVDVEEFEGE
ncbi:Mu transposase C-terminal domain-containing protein [Pseudomonas saponiphila]|uniref:Mu transposase C-terminal domain-containing protein n=1 Tax=Pseudomonas saponiphila TaxID=556534 RepID=UPI00224033BE|nr:Mu transposase C-terminal domain-containing protein [Pseudomonas saponiphila]